MFNCKHNFDISLQINIYNDYNDNNYNVLWNRKQ